MHDRAVGTVAASEKPADDGAAPYKATPQETEMSDDPLPHAEEVAAVLDKIALMPLASAKAYCKTAEARALARDLMSDAALMLDSERELLIAATLAACLAGAYEHAVMVDRRARAQLDALTSTGTFAGVPLDATRTQKLIELIEHQRASVADALGLPDHVAQWRRERQAWTDKPPAGETGA